MEDIVIINLNGPAKSGKDALAEEILLCLDPKKYFGFHVEFKELLVNAAVKAAGISRKLWDALYEREYKEVPQPYFVVNGKQVSARGWLIHISESVMKPLFGEDVFGIALAKKIKDLTDCMDLDEKLVFVISDGGFVDESVPVVDLAGEDNYHLFRISRINEETGQYYTFVGDSRNYVYAHQFPKGSQPQDYEIQNKNGDLNGTAKAIIELMEKSYA